MRTVEVKPSRFGNSAKAEFYSIQTNPETSNGRLILRVNRAEEIYIVPSPLLVGSDIASAKVTNSAPDSLLQKVEMVLTPAGLSKVRSFISASSTDNPIALVWQNEAHYLYPASKLDDSGPIKIADRLDSARATRLQKALK